ncbi:MAG: transposase [Bryobacterales bacterium]|nr:transposase [Bryobacterales bacterium]
MARSKRAMDVGCPHHINQRGNYHQGVFVSGQDRSVYLSLLAGYAVEHDLRVLGFCRITNHIHRIAVPGRVDSLTRAVGRTHNDSSRWFNIKNRRAGRLWHNRFFSCPLDTSPAPAPSLAKALAH